MSEDTQSKMDVTTRRIIEVLERIEAAGVELPGGMTVKKLKDRDCNGIMDYVEGELLDDEGFWAELPEELSPTQEELTSIVVQYYM